MGNFCESSSHNSHHHKRRNTINSSDNSNEKFPDMPLWNNGKKVGFGIKEMPAYKCNLKINELEKKRKIFWNYQKNHGRHVHQWNIIHQACVFPHIKSEEYLAEHGFKTVEGCINLCVDPQGNIFRVPNYCINDPYFEKELKPKNRGNANKIIKIELLNVSKNIKYNLNANENTKGSDLINYYAKLNKIDLKRYVIRLLYGGRLIRENETLYQHNVKNGDFIQVSVFKQN